MDITSRIKKLFNTENVGRDATNLLANDTILSEVINISSINSLNLLLAIEKEFNISIEMEDIKPVIFESVATLEGFIRNKLGKR